MWVLTIKRNKKVINIRNYVGIMQREGFLTNRPVSCKKRLNSTWFSCMTLVNTTQTLSHIKMCNRQHQQRQLNVNSFFTLMALRFFWLIEKKNNIYLAYTNGAKKKGQISFFKFFLHKSWHLQIEKKNLRDCFFCFFERFLGFITSFYHLNYFEKKNYILICIIDKEKHSKLIEFSVSHLFK